jgi:hypothetical protein
VGMFSCQLENGDGSRVPIWLHEVVDGEALYESSSFKYVFLTKHVAPG